MADWQKPGKSDEWYTPKYIFDALGCRFDLDVASPCRETHVPCKARLWEDGLNQQWRGFVWMNPPFGARNGILPWLKKFFEHDHGIALAPDRTSAPWFQKSARLADLLLFLSPKVKFERPDGTVGKIPGDGTVLMAAGPRGAAALRRASHLGLLLLPTGRPAPAPAPRSAAPRG